MVFVSCYRRRNNEFLFLRQSRAASILALMGSWGGPTPYIIIPLFNLFALKPQKWKNIFPFSAHACLLQDPRFCQTDFSVTIYMTSKQQQKALKAIQSSLACSQRRHFSYFSLNVNMLTPTTTCQLETKSSRRQLLASQECSRKFLEGVRSFPHRLFSRMENESQS